MLNQVLKFYNDGNRLSLKSLKSFYFAQKLIRNIGYYSIGSNNVFNKLDSVFYSKIEKRVYSSIGDNCIIHLTTIFETETGFVKIGNNNFMGAVNIICRDKVIIGNNVMFAWNVQLYDHNGHSTNYLDRRVDHDNLLLEISSKGKMGKKNWWNVKKSGIIIEDDVWIGFNTIILKGVKIGARSIVAAGSVVTQDIPSDVIVAGNPARIVREINKLNS